MTVSLVTPTLSLTPASDTGVSHSDGITDDAVPVFYGTASPGALVTLKDATSGLSVTAQADKYGNYVAMFAGLDAGAHALTASSMDAAGNVSPTSNPYNIDIETQATATSTAPFVSETADSVNFAVHFDQPVSAVTPASFTLVTTGDAYGNVESVTGSGEDYTVTVAGLGGTGNVGLAFSDDAPTDLAGNQIALASGLHEVADTTAGATTLVSADEATGAQHSGAVPAVSGGGRVVAFISDDGSLVPGVQTTPGVGNVYVKDLQTGTVAQVTNGDDQTRSVQISADGSTVAFSSMATDLVPGGTAPDQLNLYVAKLNSALGSGGLSLVPGSIQLIGKLDDAVPLELDGDGFALSGDGSTLAYQGDSTTPGAPIEDNVDYLVNLKTGAQTQFAQNGEITSISLDGTRVAYEAFVDVPGTGGEPDPYLGGTFPPNEIQDAFVYDAATGTSITIDGSGLLPGTNPPLGAGEVPDYLTAYPVLSGDGSTVVFQLQRDTGQISLFSVNLANPSVFSPVSPGAASDGGTDDDFDQSVSQGGGVIAYTSVDATGGYHIVIDTPSTQTATALSGGGFDPVLTTQGNAVVYTAPADASDPNSEDVVYETTLGVSASIAPIDGDDAVDAAELKQAAKSGLAASGTTDAPAGSAVLLFVLPAVPGAVRSPSFNGIVGDDGTWTATIPASVAATLTDGTYALFVQVLDAVGASAKTSRVFTVDTVAPAQPVIPHLDPGAAAGLGQNGTPVTNTATPTIDGVTDPLSLVSLYADVAGITPVAVASARADQNGAYSITAPHLGDGIQDLEVQAVDPAGNPSPFSSSLEIIVDTTPPDPPPTPTLLYYSDSPDGPVTDVPRLSVIGTAEPGSDVTLVDAITGDVLATDVVVGEDGTYAATTHELADGKYSVAAYATDQAGNVGKPSQYGVDVTIDTQAPDAPTIDSVSGGTASDGSLSPSLDISGDAEPFSQVALLVDGEPDAMDPAVTADADGAFDLRTTDLPAGAHTLSVTATDFAGNVSDASAPFSVTINDSVSAPPGTPTLIGVLTDGPIAGAKVFADANGNGVHDSGEAVALTTTNGQFTLFDPSGELIATGGTDATTGLGLPGALTAPANSTVVDPLTTLIDAYIGQTGASVAAANAAVAAALGLPGATDLTSLDPDAAALAGSPAAAIANAKLADLAADFTAALSHELTNSVLPDVTFADVFEVLAAQIAALPTGATLNLDDPDTLLATLAGTVGLTGTGTLAAVAEAAEQIVAAGNAQLDTDTADEQGQALLTGIAGVENTEQGSAATALGQIGADQYLAATLVPQYTGAPLVADASVTAALITDAPRLAPGSDQGLSSTDNFTADLSPTFVGTALPGTYVTLLELLASGYTTAPSSQGAVVGSGQADASGHYSIAIAPVTVTGDLQYPTGSYGFAAVGSTTDQNLALGAVVDLPQGVQPQYIVFDTPGLSDGARIADATPAAAPGDDAGHSALLLSVYAFTGDFVNLQVYADGGTTPIGSAADNGDNGVITLTTTPLSLGPHTLTVTETLRGGEVITGNPSYDVTVTAPTVVDGTARAVGPIAGATVTENDKSGEGVAEGDVVRSVTDDNGAYAATVPAIPNPDKPLTLTDGYDTVTGLPIGGPLADYTTQDGKGGATLVAPNDYTAISPLSSIVAGLDADDANSGFVDPNDVADNADDTLYAFGLNDTLDLSTLDPLAEAQTGDPHPLLVSIELLDTLTILARSTLIGFTFQPFADFIENNDTIDLDDPAGIAAVLAPYLAASGSGVLTAQQVGEVATIVAAGNAAIDAHAAAASSLADTLSYAFAAERLEQDEVGPAVNEVVQQAGETSTDGLLPIVASYTGTALDQAIEAARGQATQATSLLPQGPATTGAPSVTFEITFSKAVTGLAPASFQLVTGGGLQDAAITGVSAVAGSFGTEYDVTVSTGIGQGTLAVTYLGGGVDTSAGKPITAGVIAPAVTYLPLDSPNSFNAIVVGDFNGDGRPDAALIYENDSLSVTPYLNIGGGSFQAEAPLSLDAGADEAFAPVVADVNGDGHADILIADYDPIIASGNPPPSYGDAVTVLLGNGDGTFQQPINTPISFIPSAMVAGDFNGDGRIDVALTDASGIVHVLLGNGAGGFAPVSSFAAGNGALVTGDFNGDGRTDLAVLDPSGGTVSIFLGNGDGTFATGPVIAAGTDPDALAVGDLNNDGVQDIAVADGAADVDGTSSVVILLGKGDGTFTPLAPFTPDPVLTSVRDLRSIAIGDIDNDGTPDLVVGGAPLGGSSGVVSVLLGNGDGTFRLGSQNDGASGAGLALADVDGDGRTDILATGENLAPDLNEDAGLDVFMNEPETVVGSTSPSVTIDRAAIADPVLTKTSGGGALTQDGNAYTLDLGTLSQGSTEAAVLALANEAAAPADSFDGTFSTPTGDGFTLTGASLAAAIAAGQSQGGITFTADTSTPGSHSETITFAPRDATAETVQTASLDDDDSTPVNLPGTPDPDAVADELPAITLTVTDDVTPAVAPTGPAILAPVSAIVLPNVRVGGSDAQPIAITNSAASGSADLDVTATATGSATVSGSIAGLAPQAGDDNSLVAGIDTGTAGAQSGVVTLAPVSEPNTALTSEDVAVSGNVYREATASAAPVDITVHVGDPDSAAVPITNTDAPDGFSEALLASITAVTTGLSIASAGPTPDIAAGGTDSSSLAIGFSTATAGTITGSATLGLASDGGTGTGSIDGLGQVALASETVPISVTVDNYAAAGFAANGGTLTAGSTPGTWVLNLGTTTQGAAALAADLSVLNTATGQADLLAGSYAVSGGGAFTNTGFGDFGGVGAGDSTDAGTVALNTGTPGTFSETITLDPTGSNASDYSGILPSETLTINAVVQPTANAVTPAAAAIGTSLPIAFGNVHLGASADRTLSISNTAAAPAASLDASIGGLSGDATGSGAITQLAAGATDATDIGVGIDTGTAGLRSGTATLNFVSDSGDGNTAPLPNQQVPVSGQVYREASASIAPISEIVHVGDPGTATLSVGNTDPDDGYSENLIASIAGATGQIGVGAPGPTGEIAPGTTDSRSLAVSFATAAAGMVSGTANVALTSDGGIGPDSIDGLGQSVLAPEAVPVSATVDNYASAAIGSDGNLTPNGAAAGAYTLNLGTTTQGAAPLSADLAALNTATGPADWLSGAFTVSGDSEYINAGFGQFSQLAAGASADAGAVSLSTGQVGTFRETIVLDPTGGNAGGFSQALGDETVTVTGTVTAPTGSAATGNTTASTGSAMGDVHMVTFDGLHYDFQATGAFVLARATDPGKAFQIQIQASSLQGIAGVSYTTGIAAALNNGERVTFQAGRSDVVWINGRPDTTIGVGDPQQFADGSKLSQTSADSYQLTWGTGETLTVTDHGAYFDLSAALGHSDGPGSVQGLLGTDSGQASDFTLPGGTVLAQPLAESVLNGAFADAWRVTGQDSLLDDGSSPAMPSAAGLVPPQMAFLSSGTNSVIAATGSDEILTGSLVGGPFDQASQPGVTFSGDLAMLATDSIVGFGSSDLIDIVDLASASVTAVYQGSSPTGVLHIAGAGASANIAFSDTVSSGLFRTASDGHGGTLIGLA